MSTMNATKICAFAALFVVFFVHSCLVYGARIGANEVQILPLFDTRLVLADGRSQPVSIDAVSVMLNVTAVAPSGAGFITVWPCGVPRPLASHLNFEAGNTVANGVIAAIAAIGANGGVCIYSTSEIDLVVDISGWFEKDSYEALTPSRLLDTRETGLFLSPTNPITLDISAISAIGVDGQEAITPSGVKSVSLNVTTVDGKDAGFLTVWPCDQPRPVASNLNFQRAQTVANGVIAAAGQAGNTCLYASQETHVVVDLNGWLSESTYVSVKPKRLRDTRETSTLTSQAELGVDVHNISVMRDSDSTTIPLSAAALITGPTGVLLGVIDWSEVSMELARDV
jgi:hypothetical protein